VAAALPTGANDRLGVRGQTAWFGSGLPLLAWARGRGWATDPETANFAEATTSEVMELRSLSVTRTRGLAVLATGVPVSDDGRTAVFRARAVRDLLVATGPFRTATASSGGKQVSWAWRPGCPTSRRRWPRRWPGAGRARGPLRRLPVRAAGGRGRPRPARRRRAPAGVLLGKGQAQGDATGSHEVAHEWWYGLVGANQAQDPWLDEAFATYAEGLDRGTATRYSRLPVPADGRRRVGAPMTYWEGRRSYFRSVYVQGAAMLLEARAAAGRRPSTRPCAATSGGTPTRSRRQQDVAASLRHLPAAVRVLQRYGALPS
jgi:hypothetical protein